MKTLVAGILIFFSSAAWSITANQWLEYTNSPKSDDQMFALGYLGATWQQFLTYGALGTCAKVPKGVDFNQVEKIWIKYLNENPEKTHREIKFLFPFTLYAAWGHEPIGDDGFCPPVE